MVGRDNLALSTRLLTFSLLLVSYFALGEAVLCHSCTYTYTITYLGYECINNTEGVKTASEVNCPGDLCRDIVVYKKHEKGKGYVVSSASRGCPIKQHQGPNCTESTYESTCTYVCSGDKCNNGDLGYKEPPSNSATATFTHWIFASGAVMNLLLNLFI